MTKMLCKLSCTILLAGAMIWAQPTTGTISGKITSISGAAVPNAAVTITNTSTNASVKVLSGPDGTFTAATLAPGTYRVDVETTGYKHATARDVTLTAAVPMSVNISLERGDAAEVVEFTATPLAVQAENGEISATITERPVREYPVIDRNHQQLIGLESGITPPAAMLSVAEDPQRNRLYSTNGQSPAANRYWANGIDNTEPFRGTEMRINPVENDHQYHISTSNYTTDKGYSGGAVVNNVTMSGSNQIHGDVFEFNSNDDLRARDFFNVPGTASSRIVYNQFGGAMGAPIVKDKTFFFASYEGTYRRGTQTLVSTVPTAAMAGGNFSAVPGLTLFSPFGGTATGAGRAAFQGNRIPSNLINPTAATIASFFPAPNQPGFVDNFVTNVPLRNDAQKFDGRIDHHFDGNTSMYLRYGYTNARGFEGSALGPVIGGAARGRNVAQNAMIDVTHLFTPLLTTEFRFGYNRYTQDLRASSDQTALAVALGLTNFNNQFFSINVPGLPLIGTPAFAPQFGVDNTFNWAWTFGWRKGMHDLKFGVDVRRIRSDGFFNPLFGTNGSAFFGPGTTQLNSGANTVQNGEFFNSFAAFLLGQPSQAGITQLVTSPDVRQTQYAGWVGDKINVFGRLNLDFGVRYEVYTPLEPRRAGGAAFFNPANNTFTFSGMGDTPDRLWETDFDNIAPRFGFAFQATHKTVVRGGYGISFFQPPYMLSGFMPAITGNVVGANGTFAPASFQFRNSLNSLLPATQVALQNGISAGNLPVSFGPRDLETPYVQSFSLQVQQEFAGAVLSAAYVGTLGRHLPYFADLNAAQFGAGIAGQPFARFNRTAPTLFFDNSLTDNYNSFQANLTRRFSRGLSFLASYTLSKALGYTSANGMLLDPFNLRANYGPLDWDRHHVLSIGHLWDIPFGRTTSSPWMHRILGGWQLNGIFTWQTGMPMTITANSAFCNCPGSVVLPSLNGNVQPFTNNGAFFLTPAAFTVQNGALVGNLGRGTLRGPDFKNYNVSLFKHFRLHEHAELELRGEAYNIANSAHFANPVTNLFAPDFGRIMMYAPGMGPRQLNVAARVIF